MSDLYGAYTKALSSLRSPSLFLDKNAFNKNIQWVTENTGGKKIRIATKSVRCLDLLKKIHDSNPIFQGYMAYTLEEALWLRANGLKDILMGYPSMDRQRLEELAENPGEIVLMVDRLEHLNLLEEVAQKKSGTFEICLDIDLSMDLPGLRFGVYRSHVQNNETLKKFLAHLKNTPRVKLVGCMGYEAQIAGVMDEKAPLIKFLKKISLKQLTERRKNLISIILEAGHSLKFVNGGGTGSLKNTIKESIITEVTVGSAFYAPVLFDHYEDFKLTPALFFSSPIIRNPVKNIYTVLGGGYIASGSTDPIKQPTPYLPLRLKLLKNEGAGEVQTPLQYNGKLELKLGDLVIFRHAKAAEICERFHEISIIQDSAIIGTVKTYRGEGKCFL